MVAHTPRLRGKWYIRWKLFSTSPSHSWPSPDYIHSRDNTIAVFPWFSQYLESSLIMLNMTQSTPSALLTMPKPLTVWITTNCGKFLKRYEYQTTWPTSWEIHMQVKKQQLELDMKQQTSSKSGKKYVKNAYCHPAYLTYMQSTSWEMLD